MTDNVRPRPVTVRVMVHLTAADQYAVGIVTSEWQGAVRVSRRLARMRPVDRVEWYPPGCDRDVYRAYLALAALLKEQSADVIDF